MPPSDRVIKTPRGSVRASELKSLCEVVEPGIILFREYHDANAEVFLEIMNHVKKLGEPFGEFAVICDLRDAQNRPRPDMVEVIVQSNRTIGTHWAVVQSNNVIIRTIAKFIVPRITGKETSMHANLEDAIASCRRALQARK